MLGEPSLPARRRHRPSAPSSILPPDLVDNASRSLFFIEPKDLSRPARHNPPYRHPRVLPEPFRPLSTSWPSSIPSPFEGLRLQIPSNLGSTTSSFKDPALIAPVCREKASFFLRILDDLHPRTSGPRSHSFTFTTAFALPAPSVLALPPLTCSSLPVS
jgi:hypothetical protein